MEENQAVNRRKKAYDAAQEYVRFADGDVEKDLFSFQKCRYPWRHNDINTWEYIKQKLSQANISKIIDVGCGSGAWSLRIAAAFPNVEVTGIDFSTEQVSRAKKILRRYEHLADRVKFAVGDATKLDFETDEFDVSICLHDVLNHIPDYRVALNELARVTSNFNITSVHGFYAPETCFFLAREKVASYKRNSDVVHLVDETGRNYDVYFHLFKAAELAKEFQDYFKVIDEAGVSLEGKVCRGRELMDFSEHIIIFSQAKNGV